MFRRFAQRLNPAYAPPFSKSILKIMEKKVSKIDEANGALASKAGSGIAITADCWTLFNCNTGLLAVTGHILHNDMKGRHNFILDCVPLGLER